MNILITGGSGFLGRGLIDRWYVDNEIVVYSRDETKQDICRQRWPNVHYALGDVTDWDNLYSTICMYNVDTVIHTAAIKYIPEAEFNVREALRVNVEGSRTVFDVAGHARVDRLVAISTDKACQPINVYGTTKFLMERLLHEYSLIYPHTRYSACRYGNVVGSTGSVIPLFIKQFANTGKVTITNPDMTRYWISIGDAVGLVVEALQRGKGEVVIPKPAAMKLIDVAYAITNTNDPTSVEIIGERPGEKHHESLLHKQEGVRATDEGDFYVLHPIGSEPQNEGVVLTSQHPSYWLTRDQLRDYISEAQSV